MTRDPTLRLLGVSIVMIMAFCTLILIVFGCALPDQAGAGFTSQQKADLKTAIDESALNNSVVGTGRDVKIDTGGLIGTIQAVAVGLLLLTYPAGKLIWLFVGGAKNRLKAK